MASTTQSKSSLPQGFSVYQSALGAALQFFPALGSQELDDMINAFIPGSSSASEKRAAITLDFFEHAHMTGRSFKFYAVQSVSSAATSPAMASPSSESVDSSFNASPLTSSWDWSATSISSAASSSLVSSQRRRESKTNSPLSRHHTTDFSQLPGMKILTKDGVDVTNSASRGSKTKEQRDHAHLMRIIKACDSCRRKKIRCDPSHKKRGAAQPAPQTTTKPTKKAKTVPREAPPPCSLPTASTSADLSVAASSVTSELGSAFTLSGLEDKDFDPSSTFNYDPFPLMDIPDFDFSLDTLDYTSSQSCCQFSAASSLKSVAPSSLRGPGTPPGSKFITQELQARSPTFLFPEDFASSIDYTDFNLYSPSSSFSEDERMLPIGLSNTSLPNLNRPSLSETPTTALGPDVNSEAIEPNILDLPTEDFQCHSGNQSVGGSVRSSEGSGSQFTTMSTSSEPRNEPDLSLRTTSPSESISPELICCPPSTATMAEDTLQGCQARAKILLSYNSSAATTTLDANTSISTEKPMNESITNTTPFSTGMNSAVVSVKYVAHPGSTSTERLEIESSPAGLGCPSTFVLTSRNPRAYPFAAVLDIHTIHGQTVKKDASTPGGENYEGAGLESVRSECDVLSVRCDSTLQMSFDRLFFSKAQSVGSTALCPSSTNCSSDLSADFASKPKQNCTQHATVGRLTPGRVSSAWVPADVDGWLTSPLEDCNDEQSHIAHFSEHDSTRTSSSSSESSGLFHDRSPLVYDSHNGDIEAAASLVVTASTDVGLNVDLHEHGRDGEKSSVGSTYLLVTLSGTEGVQATQTYSDFNSSLLRLLLEGANTIAAMSRLALFVFAAIMFAGIDSLTTKQTVAKMKQHRLSSRPCRNFLPSSMMMMLSSPMVDLSVV